MRLMLLGDVVGRAGREAVIRELPGLRAELKLDFVAVNAENAAHGFGLNLGIAKELFAAGADVLTTGNHVWDQKELVGQIENEPRILRPLNYPPGTPGAGARIFSTARGQKVLVMNVMGRVFMDPLDDPFQAVFRELERQRLGATVQAILIDFHAETASEKMAMAHAVDGRVSLIAGTHTHVPTADAQILGGGTAYQTDCGMCGDYDSVIGMKKEAPIWRFTRKLPGEKLQPAEGPATVCGVIADTDDKTGLARAVAPIRIGGRLAPNRPAFG